MRREKRKRQIVGRFGELEVATIPPAFTGCRTSNINAAEHFQYRVGLSYFKQLRTLIHGIIYTHGTITTEYP